MPLTDLEMSLADAIERRADEMLSDLADHVAIPTGFNFKPGLDQYREVVLKRLRSIGAEIQLVSGDPRPQWLNLPGVTNTDTSIPPVAIAKRHHAHGRKRILIAGHLDTVHDPHGPFRTLSLSDDRRTCVGPGAVDMKGGILIALVALETLAQHGIDVNWTFLLNSDEETGSFHSFRALTNAAMEHDVGIALEPAMADGSLAIARMGSGQFKVETFGRSAHVGRDFEHGVSAVTALAQVIVSISSMADARRGLITNVGPLQGGTVTNAVPDHAACWGNVRFADDDASDRLGSAFDALVQDVGLPRVVVHRAFNRPAKPLTPAVQRLAEAARDAAESLGQHLPFASTGGVCDGNILQQAGLPTIDTLGVRGGNLHRTDEFVELASLVERASLLAVLLSRLGWHAVDSKL